ncbi:MAG: hypothetical protein L0228_21380 [Planctomycetes bacterium]|nr:hypothetical protein [Planctomycetota bacterium]
MSTVFGLWLGNDCRAEDPKDILYYGNSFTNALCCGGNRSVPDVIADIAVAAGHPAPRNRNAAVNGQGLEWHRLNNTAVITTGIAPGESWEHVVLQDFSTQPTHIGNLALHRSSALGLYDLVDNHSPDVEAVLFETWARGPGHSFYTGTSPSFPGGPAQMQQELRDGYHLSTGDINAAAGIGSATYAPVGDAWENAGFPLNLYASDIYHAQNRGSLLTALVLYGIIYDDSTTSDIDLTGVLANLNASYSPADARYITASNAEFLTSTVDATLMPELPGDFNDDGKVDAADYVVWRKNENTTNTLPNDSDLGGTVGADHYNLWREHFGDMTMAGSGLGSAAVPEPAPLVTTCLGMLAFAVRRCRLAHGGSARICRT